MDAITSHLDQMFSQLPRTAATKQARATLEKRSFDRYQELLAEGKTENQAVGQVIAEYGDLRSQAGELGIEAELQGNHPGDSATEDQIGEKVYSRDDADHYLSVQRRIGNMIAGGVLLLMAGMAAMIVIMNVADSERDGDPEPVQMAIGLGVMFVTLAIAVLIFIVAGVMNKRVDPEGYEALRVSPAVRDEFRKRRDASTMKYGVLMGLGVVIILLAVGAVTVLAVLSGDDALNSWMIGGMMLAIGVGVAIIASVSAERKAYDRLTSLGEYTPENARRNTILARFSGVYWLVALLVFLVWGFAFDGWDRSWIVWVVAGIGYGILSSVVGATQKKSD